MVWSFGWRALGDARSVYLARSALLTRSTMITFMGLTGPGIGSLDGLAGVGPPALSGSVARNVELQNGGVVNQPIDRGGGRHWVLEDALPVAEHQIAGDQHR